MVDEQTGNENGQANDEQAQSSEAAEATAENAEAFDVVCPGDTWEGIAQRNNTDVETLLALNAHLPHFSDRSVQVNALVRVRGN